MHQSQDVACQCLIPYIDIAPRHRVDKRLVMCGLAYRGRTPIVPHVPEYGGLLSRSYRNRQRFCALKLQMFTFIDIS